MMDENDDDDDDDDADADDYNDDDDHDDDDDDDDKDYTSDDEDDDPEHPILIVINKLELQGIDIDLLILRPKCEKSNIDVKSISAIFITC